MDTIRENRGDGKPFLAYLAFTAPHDPVQVPEPWLSKYRGRYDDRIRGPQGPALGGCEEDRDRAEAARAIARPASEWSSPGSQLSEDERALEARGMEVYAGMLEAMDYHYGRVVTFLQDIGEYDNTVVIFLSDNGANPGTRMTTLERVRRPSARSSTTAWTTSGIPDRTTPTEWALPADPEALWTSSR